MKKFLKGFTFATALAFTVSPVMISPASAFSVADLKNLTPVSNTLKASFNVNEPIATETVALSWVVDGSPTNSTQTFTATKNQPYSFTINVAPGYNIEEGIIDSENIAILLKVPEGDVNSIEGVYMQDASDLEPLPLTVIDDPESGFSYYVLAENVLVDRYTNLSLTPYIEFNTSGTYSDFEVIAVQDPIDLFTVHPGGPNYATFTLETQGDTGADVAYPDKIQLTGIGVPVSHGDFDFELVSIDRLVGENSEELDPSVFQNITLYKEGNHYEIEPFGMSQYTDRPIITLKVSGKENTIVQGLSHTIQIEEGTGKDFRYVIAIDGVPVHGLPGLP